MRPLNGQIWFHKKLMCKCNFVCVPVVLATLFFIITFVLYGIETDQANEQRQISNLNINLNEDFWIPDGGDNVTGWPTDIVPNIVHYVLFEQHKISYVHMLSMLSVIQIHRPELIYIHCDCDRIDEDDINWKRVLKLVNATNDILIIVNKIDRPTEIYGRPIQLSFLNFHASDITRYRTMRQYGGIYIDNDVFVCQSLHRFRRFEFTLNWELNEPLGSQVLIGNKNARFLKFVLETYKMYDTRQWYYNAGALPTKAILEKYPFLVHRVRQRFGIDAPKSCKYFYKEYHSDWQQEYYTFHMLARGAAITSHWNQYCLGVEDHYMKHTTFDDTAMLTMNNTFGEMSRFVLFGNRTATKGHLNAAGRTESRI